MASEAGRLAQQAGWALTSHSQLAGLNPGTVAETAEPDVSNVMSVPSGAHIQHTEQKNYLGYWGSDQL